MYLYTFASVAILAQALNGPRHTYIGTMKRDGVIQPLPLCSTFTMCALSAIVQSTAPLSDILFPNCSPSTIKNTQTMFDVQPLCKETHISSLME